MKSLFCEKKMDCDDSDELSVELVAAANSVKEQLLPATSKERYSKTYDVTMEAVQKCETYIRNRFGGVFSQTGRK